MGRYETRDPVVLCILSVLGESRRCPWKTVGDFAFGRSTLEWAVMAAAYSRWTTHVLVVSEPEATAVKERLAKLPQTGPCYAKLIHWERPPELMHSSADTGSEPLTWAMDHWYFLHHWHGGNHYPRPNLITSTFCVDPLKPPGIYDAMVEKLVSLGNQDYGRPQAVTCAARPLCQPMIVDEKGIIRNANISRSSDAWLTSAYLTGWTWMGWYTRATTCSVPLEVPDWALRHIDTPQDFEVAQLLFTNMIARGNPNIYEEYYDAVMTGKPVKSYWTVGDVHTTKPTQHSYPETTATK